MLQEAGICVNESSQNVSGIICNINNVYITCGNMTSYYDENFKRRKRSSHAQLMDIKFNIQIPEMSVKNVDCSQYCGDKDINTAECKHVCKDKYIVEVTTTVKKATYKLQNLFKSHLNPIKSATTLIPIYSSQEQDDESRLVRFGNFTAIIIIQTF